jgi:hypothetical protein
MLATFWWARIRARGIGHRTQHRSQGTDGRPFAAGLAVADKINMALAPRGVTIRRARHAALRPVSAIHLCRPQNSRYDPGLARIVVQSQPDRPPSRPAGPEIQPGAR